MTTTNNSREFEAVDSVVDTRDLDTSRKPIPGTGDVIPCECCGRGIAIHAHTVRVRVEPDGTLSPVEGSQRIIGVSCAKGLRSIFIGKFRQGQELRLQQARQEPVQLACWQVTITHSPAPL